jgi:hypothetical protein
MTRFLKIIILTFALISVSAYAKLGPMGPETKYRTNFGRCPSKAAGTLTLELVREFERFHSLKDVKELILKDDLSQKHFLSEYKISYDPLKNFLHFKFDCPKPLMKVQLYKSSGVDSYEAILVDNGELFDPTYEVLLRQEKKIQRDLPYLALPVGEMDEDVQMGITKLINKMSPESRSKLSEIIVNESNNLTIILSVQGHPSSVFMGNSFWSEKIEKLDKIVSYMEAKKKVPAVINLTNDKKVVVKFNE